MPTIVATPASPSANSYITEAEATTYFGGRLYASAYTSASTADKQAALIWATALLDQSIDWNGSIRTQTQKLRWPRSGLVDLDHRTIDYDTIPQILKDATAEMALALLSRDRMVEPDLLGLGMSEASLDVMSVKIDPSMLLDLLPKAVLMALAPYGTPRAGAVNGMKTVKLERA